MLRNMSQCLKESWANGSDKCSADKTWARHEPMLQINARNMSYFPLPGERNIWCGTAFDKKQPNYAQHEASPREKYSHYFQVFRSAGIRFQNSSDVISRPKLNLPGSRTVRNFHTLIKYFLEILLYQPEIRLYLPFSDWFGTKRMSL